MSNFDVIAAMARMRATFGDTGEILLRQDEGYLALRLRHHHVADQKLHSVERIVYQDPQEAFDSAFRRLKAHMYECIPSGNCKLNGNEVKRIRRQLEEGVSVQAVADQYEISVPTVYAIQRRESWRWVE